MSTITEYANWDGSITGFEAARLVDDVLWVQVSGTWREATAGEIANAEAGLATATADRDAQINAMRSAVSRLNTIIASVEGASVAQTQTAIKQIAQHQKALIKLIVGELI